MLGAGAILAGLGWIGSGYAETLYGLYFWYGLVVSAPAQLMAEPLGTR